MSIRRFAIIASIILVIGVVVLWFIGGYLSAPYPHTSNPFPPDLPAESLSIPSQSGSVLHAWFVRGVKGHGAIALLHGVRATHESMIDRARFLDRAGYSVLLFDFQAHGESPGEHITFGYLESRDARAAIDRLRTLAPGEPIGIIGCSLGGAAAILAEPPLNVDAAVFEMVYPTIDQAIANRIADRVGGWGKVLTPLLTMQMSPRFGYSREDLRPVDRIARLTMPKLFIVGSEDPYTPLEESRQLFDAAGSDSVGGRRMKEMWIVEGAGHVDLHAYARAAYQRRVLSFFQENLR